MHKLILLPCLLISQTLFANELIWTDLHESRKPVSSTGSQDQKQRHLKLDLLKLKEVLNAISTGSDIQHIELPLPDKRQMRFTLEASSVMAPALAKRYPSFKSWKISNPENPSITGRIDLTSRGFHGLINLENGERVFIDPNTTSSVDHYVSRNSPESHDSHSTFNCRLHDNHAPLLRPSFAYRANKPSSRPADSLRTYRIAIATTGEYSQLFGGTKQGALAAVVTTVNRLNQVFERDLSLHLELVADNDKLLYTASASDPYSNEDASAMVEENIITINDVIGKDSYDIGHVFGTGNTGGLAFLNSACGTYKAGGVTGSNSPSGEAFNIDYVAHEIGHQLGASHTFNGHQLNCSAGNRAAETAMEPGSGSSIMGYAGICGTDNLQSNSDGFFHSVSIGQIKNYTQNSTGSTCGVLSGQSNNNPTVYAGTDYTVPAETPFKLTGVASDPDADPLLHSWEQVDTGSAGGLYTDLGDNPLFRVWAPSPKPSRYFPRLSNALTHTHKIGELLPTTDRKMNFTLLSRDNRGGTSQDTMTLNVVNTGNAFAVLSQKSATTLSANQSVSVLWDVANTSKSPINCAYVNIGLIDGSGMVTPLVTNTLNDGAHSLRVPSNIVSIQNARMQVSCVANVFFAVSEGAITVLGGYPVVSVNMPSINEEDSGVRNLSFIISLSASSNEGIAINYEVTDIASAALLKKGTAFIQQGNLSSTIQIPVQGDTVYEDNQVLKIVLQKPLNAQFANGSSQLQSTGTIIDDDMVMVAANPEITRSPEAETTSASSGSGTPSGSSSSGSTGASDDAATSDSNSGGGSLSLFSMLGLLLLSIRRKTLLRIT